MCNSFFSLITLFCLFTILFPLHWGLIYTLLGWLKLSNSHWHSVDFFPSLFLTFWCLTVNSFFPFPLSNFSKSYGLGFWSDLLLFLEIQYLTSIFSTALYLQSFSCDLWLMNNSFNNSVNWFSFNSVIFSVVIIWHFLSYNL